MKTKTKCPHETVETVKSRDGTKTHGTRCVQCNKQWVMDKCTGCGVEVKHVAKSDRTRWTCRKCIAIENGGAR